MEAKGQKCGKVGFCRWGYQVGRPYDNQRRGIKRHRSGAHFDVRRFVRGVLRLKMLSRLNGLNQRDFAAP